MCCNPVAKANIREQSSITLRSTFRSGRAHTDLAQIWAAVLIGAGVLLRNASAPRKDHCLHNSLPHVAAMASWLHQQRCATAGDSHDSGWLHLWPGESPVRYSTTTTTRSGYDREKHEVAFQAAAARSRCRRPRVVLFRTGDVAVPPNRSSISRSWICRAGTTLGSSSLWWPSLTLAAIRNGASAAGVVSAAALNAGCPVKGATCTSLLLCAS
jgi:hypothetical protein